MTGSDRGVEFGQPPGGHGPPPGGWGPPPGAPPGGGGPPPGAPPGGWGPPPGGAPPGAPGGWGPPPGAPPGGWGPPPGGAPPGAPGGWGPAGGPPNPWGPAQGYPPGSAYPGGPGPGARPAGPSAPFSPGDAISFAWERVKADPGTILATIIVGFVLIFIIQMTCSFVAQIIAGAVGGVASMAPRHGAAAGMAMLGPVYYALLGAGQLVNIVVSSFFVAGMYRFALKVARGEPYSFNELFSGAPVFVSVLVANLLMAIAVSIGFVLLIVPGIILAIGLSMTLPLIIDRGLGPVEALSASWKLTDGHKGNLVIFGLLVFGLSIAGACACGVGLLLVLPIVYIAQMYIYLKLSGQPVARVAPAV